MIARLPYPGLRAFRRDEADLFFGRDDAVDTMVDRLLETRFLGVLGASGSGKSSLVRTGLFQALEGGVPTPEGTRWRIADCRPGGHPIANLARALRAIAQKDGFTSDEQMEIHLRRGPRAIAEWCAEGNIEPGWNLLILVDQFEELFNYGNHAARDDADAYAALLVESSVSDPPRIYVTITMRSDYFGACGLLPGLSQKLSDGIFLTPRMSRDACREAIVGPSSVLRFDIAEDLLNTLLNDMDGFAPFGGGGGGSLGQLGRLARQADQLPLMQYVLNRMWLRAVERSGGDVRLELDDYRQIGGLEGALNEHGKEVMGRLRHG